MHIVACRSKASDDRSYYRTATTWTFTSVAPATVRYRGHRPRYVATSSSAWGWLTPAISNVIVTVANRFGSATVRAPSIVTSMEVIGMPVSFACISISVTPHDETPARNASLLAIASAWGPDDESTQS